MLSTDFSVWLLWGLAQRTCVGLCGGVLLWLDKPCAPALRARLTLTSLFLMVCLPGLLWLPIDGWITNSISASKPGTMSRGRAPMNLLRSRKI